MSFTNQMPWGGVAGAPDGVVMVRTANFFTLLPGSPVNVLAGQSGSASVPPDMVWDWVNKQLYICTVSSGLAIDTVWTQLEFVGPFVGTDITSETITVTGTVQDQGTLNVEGATTLQSNVSVGGALTVAGDTSVGGALSVSGPFTALGGGVLGGTFTGNPIFNLHITPAQDVLLPNNVYIESADTYGTFRRLIGTDSSNQSYVTNSGGNIVGFINQQISAWLLYSDNAGNVIIPGTLGVAGVTELNAGGLTSTYLGSTGNLQVNGSGAVNGNLSVGAGLYPGGIYNIGGINAFSMYNNSGDSLLNFAPGNYIQYDGNLTYLLSSGGYHHFAGGNVIVDDTMQAGYVSSTGNVNAAGTFTGGAVSVGGGVTCSGVNAQGGQVTAGDIHSTGNIEADNSFNCQQNMTCGQKMQCAFIETTSTSTDGYSFWHQSGGGVYIRMDAQYDYGPIPFSGSSDARLKKDIAPSRVDCLESLRNVKLQQFRWIDTDEFVPVGFLTQQLREVGLDAAVAGPPSDLPAYPDGKGTFYEGVNTNVLLSLLIGAVQQLHAIVAERD